MHDFHQRSKEHELLEGYILVNIATLKLSFSIVDLQTYTIK